MFNNTSILLIGLFVRNWLMASSVLLAAGPETNTIHVIIEKKGITKTYNIILDKLSTKFIPTGAANRLSEDLNSCVLLQAPWKAKVVSMG